MVRTSDFNCVGVIGFLPKTRTPLPSLVDGRGVREVDKRLAYFLRFTADQIWRFDM